MRILYFSKPWYLDCDLPLVRAFQQLGHEVCYVILLTPYSMKSTICDIRKQPTKKGIIPVKDIPELSFLSNYLSIDDIYIANRINKKDTSIYNYSFIRDINRFICQQKCDVLHFTFVPTMYECLFYKHITKMVLTVHDPILHTGDKSYRRELFRKISFKWIPKLVFLNKTQTKDFIESYSVTHKKIFYNILGVYDIIHLFAPQTQNKKQKTQSLNVFFWGRITPYKGLEYLLKAFERLKDSNISARLTIAGGGEFYFDYNPYSSNDNIRLINRYISMQELYLLLDECDVVVCPYTDATQSGVVMTAFAMKKPVIATDVGGLKEYITDNVNGLLVPPCNVEELSKSMTKFIHSPNMLHVMSQNIGDTYYFGERSWKAIANNYLKIYQSGN